MSDTPVLRLEDWDNWPEEAKKLIDRNGFPNIQYEQGAPVVRHKKIGRPEQYPWVEWMDGTLHRITQGVDYPGLTRTFRNYLAQKAIGTEYRFSSTTWSTRDGREGLMFRFVPKTENQFPVGSEE